MSRLVLVRHGKPVVEPHIPPTFWRLSRDGQAATLELGAKLGPLNPVAVFASPEPQIVRTADVLAAEYGVPVRIDRDLREHPQISTAFLSDAAFERGVERLLGPDQGAVVGDESAEAVFRRVTRAVERMRAESPGRDLVAVTHRTPLAIYVGRTLGISAVALWRRLHFSTAVILSPDGMRLVAPRGATSR